MSKKVLVVDDDPVVRILVNEFLTSQGYQVNVVENGEACIAQMSGLRPDIVMLDLLMPDMSGIEVMRRLRSNPSTATVPILMMSSDPDTRAVANSHNVSADGYVTKPFGMKEILGALDSLTETPTAEEAKS